MFLRGVGSGGLIQLPIIRYTARTLCVHTIYCIAATWDINKCLNLVLSTGLLPIVSKGATGGFNLMSNNVNIRYDMVQLWITIKP